MTGEGGVVGGNALFYLNHDHMKYIVRPVGKI